MSNVGVGRLRALRRFLFGFVLSLATSVLLALIVGQIEQHIFRHRGELLLYELQSLELRHSQWADAQREFQHWGANLNSTGPCNEHECSFEVDLKEYIFDWVTRRNVFDKLDDYLRWRFRLPYNVGPFVHAQFFLLGAYLRAGGHPARIVATVGMRDGTVWSKGIVVIILTHTSNDARVFAGSSVDYPLMAEVRSVPRFDHIDGQNFDPQLTLHPNYLIGHPGGCEICVYGWAKFTPYADPADIHRLMRLNLSCLTRWRPCRTQSDIMPDAWAQYSAEHAGN